MSPMEAQLRQQRFTELMHPIPAPAAGAVLERIMEEPILAPLRSDADGDAAVDHPRID